MNKKLWSAVFCLCLVVAVGTSIGDEGKAWFDIQNCGMCKNFSAEEGLMDNVDWETYKISNGMLTITKIGAGYEEKFQNAAKNAQATAMKLQAGEQMHLCGFCTSYGNLMMAGVSNEEVESEVGIIQLMTSNDEAVVKQIHEHAHHTIDAYEQWLVEKGS